MKKLIYILLFCYLILATITIIFFNGTGDAGDSVTHYLFAKYAPKHPQLFFDHWAKPLFVLLASPFAQMGFIGIKVFNAIVSLLTIFFTYKIADSLHLKNAFVTILIMICSPLYYVLTFSGLTEPLFALICAICIFLCIKQKYLAACLIISFLPFVRSEGLIIVGVFALYFLIKKQGKLIPLLLFGHLVYSMIGYFIYQDFLWVFSKIPYAELHSVYGSGKLFHFVEQFLYVVGIPIYILFGIGFITILAETIKTRLIGELQLLILFSFICFFLAHTLFWYLGIFNSMGLKRVLIGVMPMVAIVSLQGFNFLTTYFFKKNKTSRIAKTIVIGCIVIFPFTSNPAALHWEDLRLNNSQVAAVESANFIKNKIGISQRIFCADPFMCYLLQVDFFDSAKRITLSRNTLEQIQPGDLLIWDNWFARTETSLEREMLDNDPAFIQLYPSKADSSNKPELIYSIYQRK